MEAYCVKCRSKKEMSSAERTTTSNGRPMAKGNCPDCGTKMSRILSKAEAETA